MATLQSGKCFTVPTFFGMCCRSEWQERMYIYKWHEVDQTKHEIFCVHIVCNEIQVKVNLEITTFFFYLRFPYCPNFFWFGVVQCPHLYICIVCMYICLNWIYLYLYVYCQCLMLTVCTKGLRVTEFLFSVCMCCTCGRIDNKADLTWLIWKSAPSFMHLRREMEKRNQSSVLPYMCGV